MAFREPRLAEVMSFRTMKAMSSGSISSIITCLSCSLVMPEPGFRPGPPGLPFLNCVFSRPMLPGCYRPARSPDPV